MPHANRPPTSIETQARTPMIIPTATMSAEGSNAMVRLSAL